MSYNIGSYGIIVDDSLSNIQKPNIVHYETETEDKQISKLFINKFTNLILFVLKVSLCSCF